MGIERWVFDLFLIDAPFTVEDVLLALKLDSIKFVVTDWRLFPFSGAIHTVSDGQHII